MKVSVSVIHYGTEFESEWKPASDAVHSVLNYHLVQCYRMCIQLHSKQQKKQRNDADEWKAEYQYYFFHM